LIKDPGGRLVTYPERKQRDLDAAEKARIRARIEAGETNVYKLAAEFHCSSSQIAGIKARLKS
jgi:hypothetical protein